MLNLNYNQGKNPLQDLINGYNEKGTSKSNNEPASHSFEALRKRYNEDPNSLSPIELLTLGSYEQNEKNRIQDEENRKKAADIQRQHEKDQEEAKQDFISSQSQEFKQLQKNLLEIQRMFDEMTNGGGDE